MRSRSERHILWPAYFDSRKSRAGGRMVPKRAAVDEPTCEEILAAARACGYDGSIDASSTFPGEARKARGRVQVERQGSKSDLLRKVSEQMRRSRQQ